MMTYILADDDLLYRMVVKQYLDLIPELVCIAECNNALEAKNILNQNQVDLLILDIEMPMLSGIELSRSLANRPFIIFISGHMHYAADAFEVDAIDYLVKPFGLDRLLRAIDKVKSLKEMKETISLKEGFKISDEESFFIKEKNVHTRIKYSDVLYIEALADFTTIILINGSKKIALVNLKNIEQQLPSHLFLRISRIHLVNRQKVESVTNTEILINTVKLGIGKSYHELVMKEILGKHAIKRYT